MCSHCGCGARASHVDHEHEHEHSHDHAHDHEDHDHHDHDRRILRLEQDVLARNDRHAARNRGWLAGRGVVALNLLSSPGSGKTTLLERTLRDLADTPLAVIEGDQATSRDAERIRAAGGRAVQINTGTGCHLEAEAVGRALDELAPASGTLLFIENVGNLVCPALFDLGEHAKVVVVSVTEGDDKPQKYPYVFHAADACVLAKIDLLPHVPFDAGRFWAGVRQVNPKLRRFELSALRGDGLADWYAWLREPRAGAEHRPGA
jgi:hydrogenase nickel incorporation protein HypB